MAGLIMAGLIMTEARLVLAVDTSTVVNVGLARGDQVLATATAELTAPADGQQTENSEITARGPA